MGTKHPVRGSVRCQHCAEKPADRYLFTMVIRVGGHDASKRTTYVCGDCAAEGGRWAERMGLVVTDDGNALEWDALIVPLEEPEGNTA